MTTKILNKLRKLGMCVVVGVAAGCVSTQTPDLTAAPVVGATDKTAICIGLTAVDPAANDGWDGDCPGADVDARGMYDMYVREGFTTYLLLNSSATWVAVRARIIEAAATLPTNGLLVITMSSHGGQLPDDNGDEADDLDEVLYLWDGPVRSGTTRWCCCCMTSRSRSGFS